MSEEARVEAGKKFARDMRRVREARGLSKEDLHEETKIPQSLIDSFESTGLFEHPMFNRVYLRSFVRTYADFLSISEEFVLDALEEALAGDYEDALEARYLKESGATPATASSSAASDEEQDSAATSLEEEASDVDEESTDAETEVDDTKEPRAEEVALASVGAAERQTPAEEPAGEEWMQQSPPQSRRIEASTSSRQQGTMLSPYVLAGGAVVLIIVVAVAYFLFRPADAPTEQTAPPVETDTTAVETAQEEEAPPAQQLSLGEAIDFTVIAEGGAVQAIRITRDGDLRRPYWIEEGEAAVFPAQERIVLEEELDNIRLLLEGYEYPTDQRDDQGRIVITREDAEAFADTVRSQPVSLTVEPDTNRVPAP